MVYIGVRTCERCPPDDHYWGSSKYLREDIHRYGLTNFKKRILKVHQTRSQALDHEIQLHEKYNVSGNKRFYNKAKQTSTGFDTTGRPGPNLGKTLSELTKKRLSESKKGRSAPNKGKPMTSHQRMKLSDTWDVTLPNGRHVDVVNMTQFCKDNDLNPSAMSAVARGSRQHHKGYKCVKKSNNRKVNYQYTPWQSKGHKKKANFGEKNGQSKKIMIDEKIYSCMREASERTGYSKYILRKKGKFL